MKTIDTAIAALAKHLSDGWHLDAAGSEACRWPKTISLGEIRSAEADARYAEVRSWSHAWHGWAIEYGAELRVEPRRIRGVNQELPTHITIGDVDSAARAVASGWTAKLAEARMRAHEIAEIFPAADLPTALRLADPLSETGFNLALTAARWFIDNPTVWPGLTPRQVPVAGLHAKWLDTHRPLVKTLASLDDLTLVERGTRVYWTYLDPVYRQIGGRFHDSLTLGDNVPLPYEPSVVLIVENKDTAILFPEMPGAIVVEGNGNASIGLLPQVPWIATARSVIYWGDIDARGYEIVNGLRERMPQVRTILMDAETYERYEEFGTNVDERGVALKPRRRRALPHLTNAERTVYLNVTDPEWTRNRRFEQERIPLPVALKHLLSALASKTSLRLSRE
jgi:hypothetical protein